MNKEKEDFLNFVFGVKAKKKKRIPKQKPYCKNNGMGFTNRNKSLQFNLDEIRKENKGE